MSADSRADLVRDRQTNACRAGARDRRLGADGWPVGDPHSRAALQKALEHLIETGEYKTITSNWGVEPGMIDKPLINGAIF